MREDIIIKFTKKIQLAILFDANSRLQYVILTVGLKNIINYERKLTWS
uniref:Uncharacterized protein n=1 Tax=viral metagenome TaxID=1070528 RepID=A0A6M3KXD2_9ZZZZ